jgi:hypothetical protein
MFPCWYGKPPQESAQKMTQSWRGHAIRCDARISRVLNQKNEQEKLSDKIEDHDKHPLSRT